MNRDDHFYLTRMDQVEDRIARIIESQTYTLHWTAKQIDGGYTICLSGDDISSIHFEASELDLPIDELVKLAIKRVIPYPVDSPEDCERKLRHYRAELQEARVKYVNARAYKEWVESHLQELIHKKNGSYPD
jgi:hypothetical protein